MFNLKRKKRKTVETVERSYWDGPVTLSDAFEPYMAKISREKKWVELQPKMFGVLCTGLLLTCLISLTGIAALSFILSIIAIGIYVYYGNKYDDLISKSRVYLRGLPYKFKCLKFVRRFMKTKKYISNDSAAFEKYDRCLVAFIGGNPDHGYEKVITKEEIEACNKITLELQERWMPQNIKPRAYDCYIDSYFMDDCCEFAS